MNYRRIEADPFVNIVEMAIKEGVTAANPLALILGQEGLIDFDRPLVAIQRFWPTRKGALSKSKLSFLKFCLEQAENTLPRFHCDTVYQSEVILSWAISKGHFAIIDSLLKVGVCVNTTGDGADTAGMKAALLGNIQVARTFIEKGGDLTLACSEYRNTMLHIAAEGGSFEIAEMILESYQNLEARNGEGMTALALSAKMGHARLIDLLLSRGANVEATDNKGNTPLSWAVCCQKKEAVRSLCAAKANDRAENQFGGSAWSIARGQEDREIQKLLWEAREHSLMREVLDPPALRKKS